MQEFKEGNACWNCKYINTCKPKFRPVWACINYEPLGKPVSSKKIADWIGISRQHLNTIINRYGVNKVIELLAIRGYTVRYELIGEYKRFYLLNKK